MSTEDVKIEFHGGWWFLISEDGVVSRWASLDLARLEYSVITGREWTE